MVGRLPSRRHQSPRHLPPYESDYLKNYEIGWKTTWLDNRLRFNGAVFRQDWNDFQFSFLGANGLTEITQRGNARIDGMEMELSWAATYNLLLTGGVAFYDAEADGGLLRLQRPGRQSGQLLSARFGQSDDGRDRRHRPAGAGGTRLPITPRFKGNLTGRYTWDIGDVRSPRAGCALPLGDRTHRPARPRTWRSGQRFQLHPYQHLDAYTTLDCVAGFRAVRGRWTSSSGT